MFLPLDASYLVHAKISPEKGCHSGEWEFPLAAKNMSLFASASSPVARDHWGKFELIIRERGDEGSSFPSLPASTLCSFLSSLSCASHLSRVLTSSPIPTNRLGKASEGGSICLENIGQDL